MSASLVGSEMCIRDSLHLGQDGQDLILGEGGLGNAQVVPDRALQEVHEIHGPQLDEVVRSLHVWEDAEAVEAELRVPSLG
eukprot:3630871-Alexandrium_andersonii.AAC.1